MQRTSELGKARAAIVGRKEAMQLWARSGKARKDGGGGGWGRAPSSSSSGARKAMIWAERAWLAWVAAGMEHERGGRDGGARGKKEALKVAAVNGDGGVHCFRMVVCDAGVRARDVLPW